MAKSEDFASRRCRRCNRAVQSFVEGPEFHKERPCERTPHQMSTREAPFPMRHLSHESQEVNSGENLKVFEHGSPAAPSVRLAGTAGSRQDAKRAAMTKHLEGTNERGSLSPLPFNRNSSMICIVCVRSASCLAQDGSFHCGDCFWISSSGSGTRLRPWLTPHN